MLLSARRDDSRDELQGHFQFEKIQYKIIWVNLKQSCYTTLTFVHSTNVTLYKDDKLQDATVANISIAFKKTIPVMSLSLARQACSGLE